MIRSYRHVRRYQRAIIEWVQEIDESCIKVA